MKIRNAVLRNLLLPVLLCLAASPAGAEVLVKTYGQPGWLLGAALDVNSSGQIVGIYDDAGGRQGFVFERGVYQDIAPAGWTDVWAWAIDESGRIAGNGTDGGNTKPFLYDDGTYTTLLPPGWTEAEVLDMSDGGHVVGADLDGLVLQGFLYRINTGQLIVIHPAGWSQSRANGVNRYGLVVGGGVDAGGQKAYAWKGGTFSNPAPVGWVGTTAVAVNDRGVIIGDGDDGEGHKCWINDGGVFTTVIPPGHTDVHCRDINNSGTVLGYSFTGAGIQHFIYRNGRYHFLDVGGAAEIITLSNDHVIAGARRTTGGGGSFEAITGRLLPVPAISANGESEELDLASSDPLRLRMNMESFAFKGLPVEWWLFVQTPTGIWSFDAASLSWLPGLRPTSAVRLLDIESLRFPPVAKAPGLYTYYFGVDGRVNGLIDYAMFIFDTLTVHIRP